MSSRRSARQRIRPPMWIAAALVPAFFSVGCAHSQPEVTQESVDKLRNRLEEVERTNGRLTVRVEELEKQLILVQDRIEANRIALERRGLVRSELYAEAPSRPPQPAPESYYGEPNPYQADEAPAPRRPVARIPLSHEQSGEPYDDSDDVHVDVQVAEQGGADDEEELVITEEEYRAFFGPADTPAPQKASPARASGTRQAQPPVTDERLPTSNELKGQKQEDKAPRKPSGADPLATYQDALADYRAGNYAAAMEGFQAFLDTKPRADYVDNALYWIGECHYGLGDFQKAVHYFQRILDELPSGNKVPDALLKMSLAYERMGQTDDARATLKKLTERYPATNPGRLGSQRLGEMQESP